MNKVMVIDFGNCILSYAGKINGEIKTGHFYSTYQTTIGADLEGVVTCKNKTIKLDSRDMKATELANTNKAEREYLEHQILLCAYRLFGSGEHHVALGAGLPIADILNKKAREDFTTRLKDIGTIQGVTEGKSITVTVIPAEVKVFAESHATLKVLRDRFSKEFGNLVIDVGLKTTDVALYDWDPNKNNYVVTKTFSIPQGLETILTPLQVELDRLGVQYKMTYIDRRLQDKKYIVRTDQGNYNLQDELMKRKNECISILTAIKNELGNINDTNKYLIGGGAELLLKIIPNALRDNQEIPAELRFKANVLGYLSYM